MIKIVQQIFKHLLSARPVLSAEEYRNAAVDFAVMDVKHSGSVQKGLVPVISSCTHCFPAEALLALTLGRHDGAGWGGAVENSGGRSLSIPRVHCPQGSEPYAKNGVGRRCISGMFGDLLNPPFLLTTLNRLSKTPSFSPLYLEDGSEPLEYTRWPGPFHGHSLLWVADQFHSQVVLCRRRESSSPLLVNGIRSCL